MKRSFGDTVARGVFACAVVTLTASVLALTYPSYDTSKQKDTNTEQIALQQQKGAESKAPEVLGEQTTSTSCISQENYLRAVARARPEVTVYFGTDQSRLTGKEILTCVVPPNSGSTSECEKPVLKLNTQCVQKLLEAAGTFVTQEESLRSAVTGKIVSSRINDNVIDVELLSQQLADLYQKNSDSDVIMSPYVTAQLLSLQAPVQKNLPNTNGMAATRYLEFDGSRQLMFQWEKGKYKMYRMSGAFPEYNPVGVIEGCTTLVTVTEGSDCPTHESTWILGTISTGVLSTSSSFFLPRFENH